MGDTKVMKSQQPGFGWREALKMVLLLELWVGLWVTLKNQFRPHITV